MNDLATITATGAPSSREQRARQSLEYHLARLRIATRLGACRPSLDVLVSQCERLLGEMGPGESVARYRDALDRAKARAGTSLAALFGTWPGDETDEQLTAALEDGR